MIKITVLPAAALLIALGACSAAGSSGASQAARNDNTPGWTGRSQVIGTNSTIAGAAAATYNEQKWPLDRGR